VRQDQYTALDTSDGHDCPSTIGVYNPRGEYSESSSPTSLTLMPIISRRDTSSFLLMIPPIFPNSVNLRESGSALLFVLWFMELCTYVGDDGNQQGGMKDLSLVVRL